MLPSATIYRSKTVLIVLACAGSLYAWLLLAGEHRDPGIRLLGLTFNSMLDHLLRGEWDVDPQAIGTEAFVHAGKTYAYFGPIPAVLRLPIIVLPNWRNLHVEAESCLCAMLLGAGAQVFALLTILSRTGRASFKAFSPSLLGVSLLSGPAITLCAKGPLLYHEPLLWAWAFSMLFVSIALSGLTRAGPLGMVSLCWMSFAAGLCLLTRVTTGAALYVAAGLLLLREIHVLNRQRSGMGPLIPWSLWGPISLLVAFVFAAAVVNEGRWQNPFEFGDLRDQVLQLQGHPDRLAWLHPYGLFDPGRIGVGLLYYIAPIWTPSLDHLMPLKSFLATRFEGMERPTSSFLITDPVWCVFATYGAFLLVRGRALGGAVPLVAGLSIAPGLMLIAWYLTFRYRVEFAPLLFTLACLGLAPWAATLSGSKLERARVIVLALSILQIADTGMVSVSYAWAALGPTNGYAALALQPPP